MCIQSTPYVVTFKECIWCLLETIIKPRVELETACRVTKIVNYYNFVQPESQNSSGCQSPSASHRPSPALPLSTLFVLCPPHVCSVTINFIIHFHDLILWFLMQDQTPTQMAKVSHPTSLKCLPKGHAQRTLVTHELTYQHLISAFWYLPQEQDQQMAAIKRESVSVCVYVCMRACVCVCVYMCVCAHYQWSKDIRSLKFNSENKKTFKQDEITAHQKSNLVNTY